MSSTTVVEINVSASEGKLLLKYGPEEKAKSYATSHFGYIRNGRYSGSVSLDRATGGIVFHAPKNTLLTEERDSYIIRCDEKDDINKTKRSLNLPGMDDLPEEQAALKFPKSWDYNAWFDAISSIRPTQLSNTKTKKGRR
jgi:hypothetical protein